MKIALLALMLVASPATDDFMIGIVAYHIPFESYKIGAGDIAKISDSGAGWIAVDFAWKDIEPENGIFDFSYNSFVCMCCKKEYPITKQES